ncbi:primosomal protein N' [Olsenella sp. HMSC062G07]|uniref:replication restart helicase PriA n=1 Tax=Olsenella sp. HMSC062G07 TaxID=1739330 RepID=UPI0008A4DA27|nr:primosomal protein N' [Olsenella sp. HMSC062G07]OFK24582.1 primosomal protein N' [Olsenella sp. HMSC062G07]
MRFASVVPDIPARAVSRCFDYLVPDELAQACVVGCTVLVSLSHRDVIGYVLAVSDEPPALVDAGRLLPVRRVLADAAFDEVAARLARWVSDEYACPLADAVRPLLAPGQTMTMRRVGEGQPWQLVVQRSGPVDERWVSLTPAGRDFVPAPRASRQRRLIEALADGAVRMAELAAMLPGCSAAVRALARRGVVTVEEHRRLRGTQRTELSSACARRPEALTEGQREALAVIERARVRGRGDVVLVDGVTGSGKTEVYLAAIEAARAQGKGAIVLVPEISLTAQTVGRFRSRFGDDVAVLHSRLSAGERFDQWDLVRRGLAHVVVGARSALFAPLADLGLIVIDEEHEASYKQDSSPRYHAREVAARLAFERGCALVLGSATPSLESLARCAAGSWGGALWTRVVMTERPGSSRLPRIRVVDMEGQFARGGASVISEPLRDALQEVVSRGEKAVMLLNRRGFASFLMCRACGAVPECPHCSQALTYHERTHELVCHSCGGSWPVRAYPDPSTCCPNCGSRYLGAYGVGTQRVEDELVSLLPPTVKVIRMDGDTTRGKGAHQRLLEEFDAAPCAVLLGTQMIAKGLDFPSVTLVGVINADTTLKLPDFRAAELSYDLLEQVAGRAGRGEAAGQVIIQTYWAGHPAIQAVLRHDRDVFLVPELKDRKAGRYPPYGRLSNVTFWGLDARAVRAAADLVAARVRERVGDEDGWELLGPADCLKARVKDRVRRHFLLKSPMDAPVGRLLSRLVTDARLPKGVSVSVDVDAYDLM